MTQNKEHSPQTLNDGARSAAALRVPGPLLRDRIIAAAVEALQELTAARLLTAIGTRDIARRAGASPASIFHHFGSVESLAEAVVARVFNPKTLPTESVNALIAHITSSSLPADAGRMMHTQEFERLSADPELRLRLGLWALGGDSTDAAYGDYLRSTDSSIASSAERLFAAWGRELRPPWTLKSFIASQVALLNGSVVRHLVDPGASDKNQFARAASSLSLLALRLKGDTHTLDDRLAEMNYFPMRDARTLRPITDAAGRKRALILDAAADLFVVRGYKQTTFAQIARAARVSESTVYVHFSSKSALASELFLKQASDLLVSRASDRPAPPQTRDENVHALHELLTTLAIFVATHIDTAPEYASGLIGSATDIANDQLLEAVVSHVARISSHPGAAAAAEETAKLIVIGLISRVVQHPADPAEKSSSDVLALIGIALPDRAASIPLEGRS
ncbi:MAG: TetR/AcrR family transcriptional regulator [Nocardiaceae bacterium]|nr:TetR/AcrR family transcriptional regulator [Nocardiaceae bacterium]